jgi:hypothetical protein
VEGLCRRVYSYGFLFWRRRHGVRLLTREQKSQTDWQIMFAL